MSRPILLSAPRAHPPLPGEAVYGRACVCACVRAEECVSVSLHLKNTPKIHVHVSRTVRKQVNAQPVHHMTVDSQTCKCVYVFPKMAKKLKMSQEKTYKIDGICSGKVTFGVRLSLPNFFLYS